MDSCSIPSDTLRMPERFYDIDSDGDVLLVVDYSSSMIKRSDRDVQEWKGKANSVLFLWIALTFNKYLELHRTVGPADPSWTTQITGADVSGPEDVAVHFESSSQAPADSSIGPSVGCSLPAIEQGLEHVAHFRVSSKHLALASPVLNEAVQSTHIQSYISEKRSLRKIPLSGDDPEALLLLLRLMHVQFKHVPREVDLRILTQIATLVDKYELLEITHLSAGGWLSGIKYTIPTELNNDLLAWLFIAEVLEEKAIFQQVRNVAIRESKGLLNAPGLHIPGQILGTFFRSSQAINH